MVPNLPVLTVSSINCNSLNMSVTSKHNQLKKIYGITKLKTDVIFLSDIRLCNRNLVSASNDCTKIFHTNPYCSYSFFFHSTMAKRGVGILINNALDFSVSDRVEDPEENFLLLKTVIHGRQAVLGSIYGPNDYNPGFFERLSRALRKFSEFPVILGGDWNCTYATDPINTNLDCLNMQRLPNIRHSELLREICTEFILTDPYRLFYPTRKDYSFKPRCNESKNRSRIDFFLVSLGMLNEVSECDINSGLQNSLFDHKAITLNFNTPIVKNTVSPTISRSIINDPELEIVVTLAVSECYVIHINEDSWGPNERAELLLHIGRIRTQFRTAGPAPVHLPVGSLTEENVRARKELLDLLLVEIAELDIHRYEEMPLSCSQDVFMEVLLNTVRNETISFQVFTKKTKNQSIKKIHNDLALEKSKQIPCRIKIDRLEKEVDDYQNNELTRELEHYALFEHINMEKMTPHFLKLAKCTKSDSKLSDIVNADGHNFENESVLREYVVKYYEELYKLPIAQRNDINGCIEDFLGQEILNSELVRSMKINEPTRNLLERNFSLDELDKAVAESKTQTAAGPDGIGNSFIKKYWKFLRVPLLKYVNYCILSGSLSQSFLTASIKLIPKKGDCSQIKNWRPISLLNCIYKIVSKTVNNRLKKITDTVLSRAQKGFTQSRFIQEVIINVVHNIAHCKSTNTPAFILALDQSKAFDSVRHDFMLEVYRFMGIGPNFSRVLNLITTGRNACIILDDNSLSRQFALETGAPQGNAPSPLQYNFCEQIALLKIELDPRVASVFNHMLVPRLPPQLLRHDGDPVVPDPAIGLDPAPAPAQAIAPDPVRRDPHGIWNPFELESNRETDKVDSFADDKTATFLATREGLIAVQEILDNFAGFSGLRCNTEKSAIMYVGDDGPPPPFLAEFNFKVVDKIKLLGISINRNIENLGNCHTSTILNITRIINFWDRFYLSLPGRINIAKTLLLSQISYLGCIISPDQEQMRTIKNLIERFIVGRLNIAKDRIFRPTFLGGLGMIDLEDFIIAQQVVWVKRAAISLRDNWRVDMKRLSNGNVITLSAGDFCHEKFPIFAFLADSLKAFLLAYGEKNDNFSKMFLLNNPLIKRGRNDNRTINMQFFSRNLPLLAEVPLSTIKIEQIALNGRLLSLDEIVANTGIEFSLATYLRLQEAFFTTRQLFVPTRISDGSATSVENFLKQFKKGSKSIRRILTYKKTYKLKVRDLTNVRSFSRLSTIFNNSDESIKRCLSFWNFNFLPMRIREFSFKLFNNSLSLNNRLAHFAPGRGQDCTFCVASNVIPAQSETFMHFFFDCDAVRKLREIFETEYFQELPLAQRNDKLKFWLFGISPIKDDNDNIFLLVTTQVFLYSLWQFKLQRRAPLRLPFEMEFFSNVSRIVDSNLLVRQCLAVTNVSLCRNWDTLRHRRG